MKKYIKEDKKKIFKKYLKIFTYQNINYIYSCVSLPRWSDFTAHLYIFTKVHEY